MNMGVRSSTFFVGDGMLRTRSRIRNVDQECGSVAQIRIADQQPSSGLQIRIADQDCGSAAQIRIADQQRRSGSRTSQESGSQIRSQIRSRTSVSMLTDANNGLPAADQISDLSRDQPAAQEAQWI